MPRRPTVPTIPDKPAGRTKPERSRAGSQHRPDPGPEQFDLWGAFTAPLEHDPAVKAAKPPRAKVRQRTRPRASS